MSKQTESVDPIGFIEEMFNRIDGWTHDPNKDKALHRIKELANHGVKECERLRLTMQMKSHLQKQVERESIMLEAERNDLRQAIQRVWDAGGQVTGTDLVNWKRSRGGISSAEMSNERKRKRWLDEASQVLIDMAGEKVV